MKYPQHRPARTATAVWLFFFLFVPGWLAAADKDSFHFTVTSDPHDGYDRFADLCDSINRQLGGPGAFHITTGDQVGSIDKNRAVIDSRFGKDAQWYPIMGNHDTEKGDAREWLRNECENGNSARSPIKDRIKNVGPPGTSRTTYSWDYGNAHFVVLNIYWNGESSEGTGREKGSDTASKGDIVPALLKWLEADLAATDKPFIFVFGHEPAFPVERHQGDSLDANPANRDAFWNLLESAGVTAYICGHTHYYSARKGNAQNIGNVWQISAGSGGRKSKDGQTFLHFVVNGSETSLHVYRNEAEQSFAKTAVYRNTNNESFAKAATFTFTPAPHLLTRIKKTQSTGQPAVH